MTGKMEGEMKIAGEIEHSRHPLEGLHGNGHLMVRNGDVPSLELNANLMKLAHYNDLGPAKNDPSSFNFVSCVGLETGVLSRQFHREFSRRVSRICFRFHIRE
jgi:hypothetical protein